MTIAPPVPYFGGKQRIAHRIADLLPEHLHYVEPYCGGLSVLMAKTPSRIETVNDLDEDLVTFWRVLRDQPDDLARACALTPHSRVEHRHCHDRPTAMGDVERARRVWVQLTQGRTGTLLRTGWRFHIDPAGTTLGMSAYLDGYLARFAAAVDRLHHVSLERRPALEVIDAYGRHDDVLLYVDPPYLGDTRTGRGYRHEMPNESDHQDLADALRSCRAAVVVSGYRSPLYDDLFAGWDVHEIRASTGQGSIWKDRVEVLWSNRELGAQARIDVTGGEA